MRGREKEMEAHWQVAFNMVVFVLEAVEFTVVESCLLSDSGDTLGSESMRR